MTIAKGKKKKYTVEIPLYSKPLDLIKDHLDGCICSRCAGLTECHICNRIKLDIDWCFNCTRLVL